LICGFVIVEEVVSVVNPDNDKFVAVAFRETVLGHGETLDDGNGEIEDCLDDWAELLVFKTF